MSNSMSVDPVLTSGEGGTRLENYRSRPKQLARWLLESRDTLREKYQGLKVELKRLKVRVSDVTKSRDNWRQQAETSDEQRRAMQAEVERLTVLRCCLSLKAVPKTLGLFFPGQARQGFIPHATTGRMWLLRLGYYKLHAPLEQAGDWVLLADHAVEIGKHRILGILGIRLSSKQRRPSLRQTKRNSRFSFHRDCEARHVTCT